MQNIVGQTYQSILHSTFPSLDGNKYYRSDIPRIDQDQKAIWLDALTSGKYEQGQNMLKTPQGKYCCLGVYCDVVGIPEHTEVGTYNDVDKGPIHGAFPTFGDNAVTGPDGIKRDMASSVVIPEGYRIKYPNPPEPDCGNNWYKFRGDEVIFYCKQQGPTDDVWTEIPAIPESQQRTVGYDLPTMNDSGEFTFSQIADIIRYFL